MENKQYTSGEYLSGIMEMCESQCTQCDDLSQGLLTLADFPVKKRKDGIEEEAACADKRDSVKTDANRRLDHNRRRHQNRRRAESRKVF